MEVTFFVGYGNQPAVAKLLDCLIDGEGNLGLVFGFRKNPMLKTLYLTNRDKWRAWLASHHASETEIWLIYYKKHTAKPRISYEHAVEEALCFGWVDSLVKKIDEDRYAQKFTPRRDYTKWSSLNKQRVPQN